MWQTFLHSPSWEKYDFLQTKDASILDLIHAEDKNNMISYMQNSFIQDKKDDCLQKIRFKISKNEAISFTLKANKINGLHQKNRYLLCQLVKV